MRAMILAAGLGTRLRPLSDLLPKPALPVRGIPVVGYLLSLLARHGVSEVILNLHHLPEVLREAVAAYTPPGLRVLYSEEPELLGTGGGLRRAAEFLRESDPCLVLSGDMILDTDLGGLVERHRERGDLATLLLRRDPRDDVFGTIGVDEEGCVRRIGDDFDLGGEADNGVFVSVRCLAARAFDSLPAEEDFEDLREWFAPQLREGSRDIRGEILTPEACGWEPVGTPAEYLAANFAPPYPGYLDLESRSKDSGCRWDASIVIGKDARVAQDVHLERVVVWPGEVIPAGTRASDGVFAGGRFYPCTPNAEHTLAASSASAESPAP